MTDYSSWCRGHFALMSQGGIWGVPRSGLIFTKRGEQLVLTQRMPYTPELAEAAAEGKDVPLTPEELRAYQDADYELIRQQFTAAGIEVVDGV